MTRIWCQLILHILKDSAACLPGSTEEAILDSQLRCDDPQRVLCHGPSNATVMALVVFSGVLGWQKGNWSEER